MFSKFLATPNRNNEKNSGKKLLKNDVSKSIQNSKKRVRRFLKTDSLPNKKRKTGKNSKVSNNINNVKPLPRSANLTDLVRFECVQEFLNIQKNSSKKISQQQYCDKKRLVRSTFSKWVIKKKFSNSSNLPNLRKVVRNRPSGIVKYPEAEEVLEKIAIDNHKKDLPFDIYTVKTQLKMNVDVHGKRKNWKKNSLPSEKGFKPSNRTLKRMFERQRIGNKKKNQKSLRSLPLKKRINTILCHSSWADKILADSHHNGGVLIVNPDELPAKRIHQSEKHIRLKGEKRSSVLSFGRTADSTKTVILVIWAYIFKGVMLFSECSGIVIIEKSGAGKPLCIRNPEKDKYEFEKDIIDVIKGNRINRPWKELMYLRLPSKNVTRTIWPPILLFCTNAVKKHMIHLGFSDEFIEKNIEKIIFQDGAGGHGFLKSSFSLHIDIQNFMFNKLPNWSVQQSPTGFSSYFQMADLAANGQYQRENRKQSRSYIEGKTIITSYTEDGVDKQLISFSGPPKTPSGNIKMPGLHDEIQMIIKSYLSVERKFIHSSFIKSGLSNPNAEYYSILRDSLLELGTEGIMCEVLKDKKLKVKNHTLFTTTKFLSEQNEKKDKIIKEKDNVIEEKELQIFNLFEKFERSKKKKKKKRGKK